MNNNPQINYIFPCPVYITERDTTLSPKERKEIRKIIDKEGMHKNTGNDGSNNSYIFEGKLKGIKQFCEEKLRIYVQEIINPKEAPDIYITQSWLNVTKPGGYHHAHSHSNSIISGVFYISTEEDDRITFSDPNHKLKNIINFGEPKEFNPCNSLSCFFPSVTNQLTLFPSWLDHEVRVNEKATTDRISLSFNTFVKGTLGFREEMTELIIR